MKWVKLMSHCFVFIKEYIIYKSLHPATLRHHYIICRQQTREVEPTFWQPLAHPEQGPQGMLSQQNSVSGCSWGHTETRLLRPLWVMLGRPERSRQQRQGSPIPLLPPLLMVPLPRPDRDLGVWGCMFGEYDVRVSRSLNCQLSIEYKNLLCVQCVCQHKYMYMYQFQSGF